MFDCLVKLNYQVKDHSIDGNKWILPIRRLFFFHVFKTSAKFGSHRSNSNNDVEKNGGKKKKHFFSEGLKSSLLILKIALFKSEITCSVKIKGRKICSTLLSVALSWLFIPDPKDYIHFRIKSNGMSVEKWIWNRCSSVNADIKMH